MYSTDEKKTCITLTCIFHLQNPVAYLMLQKLIERISDEDFFFLVLLSWLQFKINIVDSTLAKLIDSGHVRNFSTFCI